MKKEDLKQINEYNGKTVFIDTETLLERELMASDKEYEELNRKSDEAEKEANA